MSTANQQSLLAARDHAITRWKRGHHAFHIQLTVINTLVEKSLAAIQAGDYSMLVQTLHHLRILYDAATASMKYAAEFPREMYEDFLRPSMMPPFLSPGFSGTLNTEHNVMVNLLKHLAQDLDAALGKKERWPPEITQAWAALVQAQHRNRNNHSLICHKFVDDGVSLLKRFYSSKKLLTET